MSAISLKDKTALVTGGGSGIGLGCAQALAREGVLINMSSISGKRAAAIGGVAYNASKFAVAALSTSVANEEALNNIRITTIFPGEVDTPILEHRPQPVSAERRAKMLLPEDVADMVVALCKLPPRAHVPELVIKPTAQEYF